ncbi:MAG: hypothetical protein KDA60_17305 [Planctomycetales bacterium]|nr:hypothetical protein [Planctomycetales bacterium]
MVIDKKVFSLLSIPVMLLAVVAFALSGCNSSNELVVSDDPQLESIRDTIDRVPDSAGRKLMWDKLWAGGKSPTDNKVNDWYKSHSLIITNDVKIDGDTATVRVQSMDADSNLMEHVWTLVKEGEDWKLKDAPMTAASGG